MLVPFRRQRVFELSLDAETQQWGPMSLGNEVKGVVDAYRLHKAGSIDLKIQSSGMKQRCRAGQQEGRYENAGKEHDRETVPALGVVAVLRCCGVLYSRYRGIEVSGIGYREFRCVRKRADADRISRRMLLGLLLRFGGVVFEFG